MEYFVYFLFSSYLLVYVDGSQNAMEDYCPMSPAYGDWKLDYKDGYRCILRCDSGFEPSHCPVIRRDKNDFKWMSTVPICVKPSLVSGKTLVKVGAGAAALVAAPYALAAAGFGAAGVAAGSLAAWLQGPATAAGSWFALCQSAGAAGLSAGTTYKTVSYLIDFITYCEAE